MKTTGQLSALLCVTAVHCTLYVRTPLLDKATVHTERIGGSFAYKTTELLAYSPIVYNYNVPNVPCTSPLTVNCHNPWFALLIGSPSVDTESEFVLELEAEPEPQSQPQPQPEADVPEPIHHSVVTLDDNDTVTIHATVP